MVVASFTNVNIEYDVTIENGQAVSCTCPDHQYRGHKPGHICKHRISANSQIQAEIDRAETFLALKRRVENKEREARETADSYMRIFNSPW